MQKETKKPSFRTNLSELHKAAIAYPWVLYKSFGRLCRTLFGCILLVMLAMMLVFLMHTPGNSTSSVMNMQILTTLSVTVIINLYALNVTFTGKTSYLNLATESVLMGWLLLLNYYLGNLGTLIAVENFYPLIIIFVAGMLACDLVAVIICKLKGQDISWYWNVITGTNLNEKLFGR